MPQTAEKKPAPPKRTKNDAELRALYERVGSRLLQLREHAGMSQQAASDAIFGAGVSRQSEISKWERGLILPNLATLHHIATFYGVGLAGLGLYEPDEAISATEIARAREHLQAALRLLEV